MDLSAALSWFIYLFIYLFFTQPFQCCSHCRSLTDTGFQKFFLQNSGVSRKMTAAEWKLVETDYQFNVTLVWLVLQKIYSRLQFPVLNLAALSAWEVQYFPRACLHLQGFSMACTGGSQVELQTPSILCSPCVSILVSTQRQGIYIKINLFTSGRLRQTLPYTTTHRTRHTKSPGGCKQSLPASPLAVARVNHPV